MRRIIETLIGAIVLVCIIAALMYGLLWCIGYLVALGSIE